MRPPELPFPFDCLDAQTFRFLTGPGIYIARVGREIMYIGSAKCLAARFSDEAHDSLKEAMGMEGAHLEVVASASEFQARDIEAALIAMHLPRFNQAGKGRESAYAKELNSGCVTDPAVIMAQWISEDIFKSIDRIDFCFAHS